MEAAGSGIIPGWGQTLLYWIGRTSDDAIVAAGAVVTKDIPALASQPGCRQNCSERGMKIC
jgi:hypothetical protein